MDKVRAAGLKKTLLAYQEETVADIKQRARSIKETSGSTTRRLESSDDAYGAYHDVQEVNNDLSQALIWIENKKLACINEALKRLEVGQCGFCNDCSEEISEKRLEALPYAIRCKDCEELRESGVKLA